LIIVAAICLPGWVAALFWMTDVGAGQT
jgi:hypothetical protein